jgi:UDP-N-acetylmuramoyl-tripeptide--D-alanyl-D-alanine ligase
MNLHMPLKELLESIHGRLLQGNSGQILEGLNNDSRILKPGQFFWPLKGENTDGHVHLESALHAGASGFVVENKTLPQSLREHPEIPVILVENTLKALQNLAARHRDRHDVVVAAITGSNGKTTTKEMLASILRQKDATLATPGNLNSQIGLPLALLELQDEQRVCVLEMGASEEGNIRQLTSIARPRFGVITNIGHAHIGFFGTLQKTARAKWELIESLPESGHAVLPAGDPYLSRLIPQARCPVTLFGDGPGSTVHAHDIREGEDLQFTLELGSERFPVRLHTLGRFNILNALAAGACAWRMGYEPQAIQRGLDAFVPFPMRMAVLSHPSGAVLVNDAYNANPDSMKASLESFYRHFKDHRRIAVLGSMLELGKESRRLHKELGAFLKNLPGLEVHLIGEGSQAVDEGAKRAGAENPLFYHPTPEAVRAALLPRLLPQVAVLFKASRGLHLENIINDLGRPH